MVPRILSTGSYVPQRRVSNDELARTVDTSDEWIFSHTGIRSRYIAEPQECTSDLAYHAAVQALDKAGMTADQLEMILVATSTPDYLGFPSVACLVQEKLQARRSGALDVSAACTGFVYALELARSLITAGTFRNVLVIGAEVFSRVVNWQDRNTCVLFGDGAGAVLLGEGGQHPFYPSILHSDGSGADALLRPAGGVKDPQPVNETSLLVSMDGRRVYNFAVKAIKDCILEVLDRSGVSLEAVQWIVPHQANIRIVESAAKRLELPMDRFFTNIHEYANTSGATIPLALAQMDCQHLVKSGDLVLTVGFGAGLTYGANLFHW